MIGDQPTGKVPGVRIVYSVTAGLSVELNGEPADLAIASPEGLAMVSGPELLREIEAAVINGYRDMLRGRGHLTNRRG